ncbi:MAG: 2TM domain-containing protein [Rhizobacter sp.]
MRRRDLPPDSIEARAYRRVRRKFGFYTHALVFVLVNLGLYVINEFSGRHRGPVIIWGWAVGLLIHGVFTFISLQGEGLRERMLREEIERMKRDRSRDIERSQRDSDREIDRSQRDNDRK